MEVRTAIAGKSARYLFALGLENSLLVLQGLQRVGRLALLPLLLLFLGRLGWHNTSREQLRRGHLGAVELRSAVELSQKAALYSSSFVLFFQKLSNVAR